MTCNCAVVCLATRHGDWGEDCHRNRSDDNGHQVVEFLRVAFRKLVKVQTLEAESTEHTRVPSMHTAEEALRELERCNQC